MATRQRSQALEIGRYEIHEDMFALIQQPITAAASLQKSEHHEKYVDIQYLIDGEEEIQLVGRPSDRNIPVEDRLEEQDYALYKDIENESELILKPGMFVVYLPNDLHRPNCSNTGGTIIKKAVIKIHKNLLGL